MDYNTQSIALVVTPQASCRRTALSCCGCQPRTHLSVTRVESWPRGGATEHSNYCYTCHAERCYPAAVAAAPTCQSPQWSRGHGVEQWHQTRQRTARRAQQLLRAQRAPALLLRSGRCTCSAALDPAGLRTAGEGLLLLAQMQDRDCAADLHNAHSHNLHISLQEDSMHNLPYAKVQRRGHAHHVAAAASVAAP